MKKFSIKLEITVLTVLIAIIHINCDRGNNSDSDNGIKDGDIIFQTEFSGQSYAVQLATHFQYSHCGIIFKDSNKIYVYEGVQPVRQTPIDSFINRGIYKQFEIKRLKNAKEVLTPETIVKMKRIFKDFEGKDYDYTFNWSDDQIYCSELVWKMYKRATGIEIGNLQHLRDLDLSSDVVMQKLRERYGDSIPMNEPIISPASIYKSKKLRTVISYKGQMN
jgi:hypothetical protein